jgi:hypothetical protein
MSSQEAHIKTSNRKLFNIPSPLWIAFAIINNEIMLIGEN